MADWQKTSQPSIIILTDEYPMDDIMTFDEITARIKQLEMEAEQTAGQHNMKVGQLKEAQNLYGMMVKQRDDALEAASKLNDGTDVVDGELAA